MGQIIIFLFIIVLVIVLLRKVIAWKMLKSYNFIIDDLKERNAFDPESAVELSYARRNFLKIGLRDYRPKILVQLVINGVVGVTEDGRYFLIKTDI